jgi:hypothetical protein
MIAGDPGGSRQDPGRIPELRAGLVPDLQTVKVIAIYYCPAAPWKINLILRTTR